MQRQSKTLLSSAQWQEAMGTDWNTRHSKLRKRIYCLHPSTTRGPQASHTAPILRDVQNTIGQSLEQPVLKGARLEYLQWFPLSTVILWFYNHKTIYIRLLTFQVPTRILALFSKYTAENWSILNCGRTSPNRFSATSSNSILLKLIYIVRHNPHGCTFNKGNGSCRWNVTQKCVSTCLQTENYLFTTFTTAHLVQSN